MQDRPWGLIPIAAYALATGLFAAVSGLQLTAYHGPAHELLNPWLWAVALAQDAVGLPSLLETPLLLVLCAASLWVAQGLLRRRPPARAGGTLLAAGWVLTNGALLVQYFVLRPGDAVNAWLFAPPFLLSAWSLGYLLLSARVKAAFRE